MKETKEKLLQTAIELFAKHGINGVSTRMLAKESGVNLSSINYYFGGKQKLYDAVLESIVEKISAFIASKRAPLLEAQLPPNEEFKVFIGNLIDFLCSNTISNAQAEIVIKEIIQPSGVYNQLYAQVIEPMHKRLTTLVMQTTTLTEQEAIIQVHCLMGQAVNFKIHKHALLRRLNLSDYTPQLICQIKAQVFKNCDILLMGGQK